MASDRMSIVPREIWSYDLSQVTRQAERAGLPNSRRVEAEFRRFLALAYLFPREDLAASAVVDHYWHHAIQDTQIWADLCEQAFRQFLHHIPDRRGTGMDSQFQNTLRRYRAVFGEPDSVLWATPGNSCKGKLAVGRTKR